MKLSVLTQITKRSLQFFICNIAFLLNMTEDGRVVPKLEDEIVAATLVVQHGSVRHNAETRENPETSTQKDTD